MRLTKYGHACVFIENNKKRLIIDPGDFTLLPDDLSEVEAIILTHVHGDHTDPTNIAIIHGFNPSVVVYGTQESIDALQAIDCEKVAVNKPMSLKMIGVSVYLGHVDHAVIWESSPCSNLTVRVADFFYYPGDSFEKSDQPVEVLGVPVSAPWLKLSEAMSFALESKATYIMPTHNGILNDAGDGIVHNWLENVLEGSDASLLELRNNEDYSSPKDLE